MNQTLLFSITDFKLVFRDPSLRFFLFMPLIILLFVNPLLPYLVEIYPPTADFIRYLLMGALIQVSVMFGFIYSSVFIDEKDLNVSKMYGVLPISRESFIFHRLMIPFSIATFINFLLLKVIQPFYAISMGYAVLLSLLASLIMLILAMAVSIPAKNKMEGMTYFKLINTITVLPLLAFFAPKFEWLFAIIPTHWLFQSLDLLIEGRDATLFLSIGLLFSISCIYFLVQLFSRKQFQ